MFNCKGWKRNAYDLIFSSNLSKYVRGNAWNVIEGIDLEIEWLKKSKEWRNVKWLSNDQMIKDIELSNDTDRNS